MVSKSETGHARNAANFSLIVAEVTEMGELFTHQIQPLHWMLCKQNGMNAMQYW